MPGLIGFVGPTGDMPEQTLLADMARALEPDADPRQSKIPDRGGNGRFCVEVYHEPCLGLGRVGLPFFRNGSQPVWDDAHSLGVIMEGEIYNRSELLSLLVEDPRQGREIGRGEPACSLPGAEDPREGTGSDAGLLLQLFRAHGADFARDVNGAFIAAFWDRRRRRLTLINDRMGLYPLYWAEVGGRLIFASGVRALLADPNLPRRVDRLAIAQFLTFDHVLGTRTLLEDVHLLTPASILTWELEDTLSPSPHLPISGSGHLRERGYWAPVHPEYYPLRTEAAWMDDLTQHLRQAVHREAPNGRPAGILLSGGLDSRVILAFLAEQSQHRPVTAFTWGIPGCDDLRYARTLARAAGVPHRFEELPSDWLLHGANEAIRVTDGLGNIVNLHALATAEAAGRDAQVIYKGFLGDAMFGYGLRHFHYSRYDPADWAEAHMQAMRDRDLITFDTAERTALFSDEFKRSMNPDGFRGGDRLMESYAAVMAESASTDLSDQRIVYDFRQRVPRMTLNGVEALRGRMIVRLPFAENDLVEFSLTIPPGLRYDRRLIKNAFIRAFPAYAQIPVTETGMPMMDNLTTVRLEAENWARWHLRRVSKRVHYPRRRPYQDYRNAFREALRPWIEGTLLDQRTLERGYFVPQTIRRLVAEHMAGANHTVKLGALMTLELWHRRFVDRHTSSL